MGQCMTDQQQWTADAAAPQRLDGAGRRPAEAKGLCLTLDSRPISSDDARTSARPLSMWPPIDAHTANPAACAWHSIRFAISGSLNGCLLSVCFRRRQILSAQELHGRSVQGRSLIITITLSAATVFLVGVGATRPSDVDVACPSGERPIPWRPSIQLRLAPLTTGGSPTSTALVPTKQPISRRGEAISRVSAAATPRGRLGLSRNAMR